MLAATIYQENHDGDHKLWNIVSGERYILHMQLYKGKIHNGKIASLLQQYQVVCIKHKILLVFLFHPK
jgi:hypothetical protein